MKILFLSNIPTPYNLQLIREANKRRDIVMYGYFLRQIEKNRDWKLNLGEKNLEIANFRYLPKDYLKFCKFFRNFSPEMVLIGGYNLPLSNFAIFLAKIKSSKIFFWLEKPIERKGIKKILKNFYIFLKFKFSDGILAIGRFAQDIYKNFSDKVFNFPYSLDLDAFYKIKRDDMFPSKIKFLFSGQLIKRKNILNLIKAFLELDYENTELNIIGSGELENEIKKIINNNEKIKLHGFIQPNDLYKIYSKNNVFILPSWHDGWGLVINEAMGAAMPIISTKNVGAAVEYINHLKNGYLCGIEIESIKKALSFYIENKNLIFKHGQKNREIIMKSTGDVKNAVKYLTEILKKQTRPI